MIILCDSRDGRQQMVDGVREKAEAKVHGVSAEEPRLGFRTWDSGERGRANCQLATVDCRLLLRDLFFGTKPRKRQERK